MSRYYAFESTSTVPLVDIVIRESWQVRKKLTEDAVARYAAIYKAGGSMDPVTLARVNGGLILVDGAHRIAARQVIGHTTVEAVITTMKETDAQWAAASANLEHGVRLKTNELRAVFRHYIATGQHRKGRGKVKPLTEIAKDIPGRTHHAYRRWLMADHPDLYRKSYAGSGASGFTHGGLVGSKKPSQRTLDLQAIADHLNRVKALALTFPAAADRRRVVKHGTAILEELLM